MADDPWAAWKPTANPTAKAQEAYQARRALSRGLSADPMSPGAPSSSRPPVSRPAPSFAPVRTSHPAPSSSTARRPLPEQSFPGAAGGRGNFGPSRSGAAKPAGGHLDRGWASKTGHEEPIAKPVIIGDIESASNAPLTEAQRREQQNTRSSRQDLEDRSKRRLDDDRRDLDRRSVTSRDIKRPRSRSRERQRDSDRDKDRARDRGRDPRYSDRDSDRDRDRKRPRRDEDDDDRRRPRKRSRSRSRSRSPVRPRRDDERDRRREPERRDRRRDDRDRDRDSGRDLPSSSRSERSSGRDRPRQIKEESPEDQRLRRGTSPRSQPRDRTPDVVPPERRTKDPTSALYGVEPKNKDYGVIVRGVHEGTTAADMKTILAEHGQLTYCEELQESGQERGTTAYEVGFATREGAVKAVDALDGLIADGKRLKVTLLENGREIEYEQVMAPEPVSRKYESSSPKPEPKPTSPELEPELKAATPELEPEVKLASPEPEVRPASPGPAPGLKLKGFASKENKDSSLLSRLGAPVKAGMKINGTGKANGNGSSKLPKFVQPYDGLLLRAGVDSLDKLKRLVRPGKVKEYIEMLCSEFPDEELLKGLTARWALKERLEEWLGEQAALQLDWKK